MTLSEPNVEKPTPNSKCVPLCYADLSHCEKRARLKTCTSHHRENGCRKKLKIQVCKAFLRVCCGDISDFISTSLLSEIYKRGIFAQTDPKYEFVQPILVNTKIKRGMKDVFVGAE